MLNVWPVELGELRPACGAMVVFPALAPSRVRLKLQPHPPEVPGIVDSPLLVRIGGHLVAPISLGANCECLPNSRELRVSPERADHLGAAQPVGDVLQREVEAGI